MAIDNQPKIPDRSILSLKLVNVDIKTSHLSISVEHFTIDLRIDVEIKLLNIID